ncbi:MAG: TldD/PmbA family protein [Candidatus Hydrogenedentes bacterium]|nr:TldD/PmbA family protein [Candidatus Hydrogenedentota bacterium]
MIDLVKHAEEILSRALRNGGGLAEIYCQESAMTSVSLEDNKVEKVITGAETGAGIRILSGDRTLYGHTNDVTLDGLLALADTVAGGADEHRPEPDYSFRPERFAIAVKRSAQDVATADKVKLVHAANQAARGHDPRIVQVSVTYADAIRRIAIANSQGRLVEDVRPQILLMVQAVGAEKGVIQTGVDFVGGTVGFELFDERDAESVALEAARQAALMLDADAAPTGRMPVVLSSEAGGTMIHEAVGHGLEADLVDKGMSKFGGRLGEPVAAPEVTVVDDATVPGKRGSCSVDDEGTPAQRTVLIEEGRLVRFMNDLRTARKMGHSPTGNGRRASYEHKPLPRMTNTMILPGTSDPGDILASTDTGLYVRKMGGGQVNTLNGDFVFEVSEGYLIRNGRAETPVRGATLIGNGPDVLLSIEAVGSDLGYAIGTCGKAGQGAPVSDAQPTLRIRELTIGGTAR